MYSKSGDKSGWKPVIDLVDKTKSIDHKDCCVFIQVESLYSAREPRTPGIETAKAGRQKANVFVSVKMVGSMYNSDLASNYAHVDSFSLRGMKKFSPKNFLL